MTPTTNTQIIISRIISDIRNGIPVIISEPPSDDFGTSNTAKSQNSRKKSIMLAAESIHHQIPPTYLKHGSIITTRERKKFTNDPRVTQTILRTTYELNQDNSSGFTHTTEIPEAKLREPRNISESTFLEICKVLSLEPIAIIVDSSTIQEALPDLSPSLINEVDTETVQRFLYIDQYKLQKVADSPLVLREAANAQFYIFRGTFYPQEHYAILINDPLSKHNIPAVRIHSSCYTGDLLASLTCDCRDQLQYSISFIENNCQSGMILYIMQEGRGIGLANKIKTYTMQQKYGMDTLESNLALGFKADERSYEPATQMLQYFNIKTIELITNNADKAKNLTDKGITINKTISTPYEPSQHNQKYLQTKIRKMGHKFENTTLK